MMDSTEPGKFVLRSRAAASSSQRFSLVVLEWPTQPRREVRQPAGSPPPLQVSLRVKPHRRRSVWTRLGWRRGSRWLSAPKRRGFWSFRKKYRWRPKFSSSSRRLGSLTGTDGHTPTAGGRGRPQRGGATASKGRGQGEQDVSTRKQLDAQLDEYMSLSRSRLDQQLDEYMSLSRQRLDAELDEYMSMAGGTELHWDPEGGGGCLG